MMTRSIQRLCLVAALLGAAAAAEAAPPAPTSPPLAAPAGSAGPWRLVRAEHYKRDVVAPHAGRLLVVNFWAGYCLPCLKEMPDLLRLPAAHADVDVVFVSTDAQEALPKALQALRKRRIPLAQSFVADVDDPAPFIDTVDPNWGGEVPFTVIYDRQGRLAATLSGQQNPGVWTRTLDAVRRR